MNLDTRRVRTGKSTNLAQRRSTSSLQQSSEARGSGFSYDTDPAGLAPRISEGDGTVQAVESLSTTEERQAPGILLRLDKLIHISRGRFTVPVIVHMAVALLH